jgi:hypothetical protein
MLKLTKVARQIQAQRLYLKLEEMDLQGKVDENNVIEIDGSNYEKLSSA